MEKPFKYKGVYQWVYNEQPWWKFWVSHLDYVCIGYIKIYDTKD